ncbi:hypothetical protein E2C01_007679 [Portunus trituberculatus]|uniref:Uncharacterized protein n=1 Tax=Portunus trituberculatus TaxID=210409 RepID=A0A5B7D126_PORTR|nr:hypothetical protein [Portunus trituberculatus]
MSSSFLPSSVFLLIDLLFPATAVLLLLVYPIAVSRPLSSSFVLTQRLPKEERGREAGRGRKEGNGLVELMVTEVVLVIAREVVLLVARVGGDIDGSIGVGGGEIVAHLCLLVMNGKRKEAAVMGCTVLCCGGEHCRLWSPFCLWLRCASLQCCCGKV